jgi:peptide-methionine (S)-S-oxide reductase
MKTVFKYLLISILFTLIINDMNSQNNFDTITLGSGCFWCSEAVFSQLKGVETVTSGYSGGETKNPTYREVCSGNTGHAEVVQVVYNPEEVSLEKILEVFFKTHDPTMLNRQGMDVGTQYRSIILYHNAVQKQTAEFIIEKLNLAGIWNNPIVTAVEAFTRFYKAEAAHQDYYSNNPNAGYCQFVINPKIEKLKKVFAEILK